MSSVRPAAGIIPVRSSGEQVYLVRRSSRGSFFPGFHAFPGGAQEPVDEEVRPERPSMACALRELFEETGGWIGPRAPSSEERHLLLQRKLGFAELVGRYEVDWDSMVFAGVRITPDYSPVRYAADFFVVEPAGALDVWPGELENGAWWDVEEAYRAWKEARICLAAPTQRAIARLLESAPGRARGSAPEFAHESRGAQPGEEAAFLRAAERLRGDDPNTGDYIPVFPDLGYVPLETPTLPPARHTLCYLVGDLVVDPGSCEPDRLARLERVLDNGRRARAVLLTHHHPDHVGGLGWAKERGLPIWAHRRTGELLGLALDREIGDAEWIADGVQALHTPGHASGHLALWLPEKKALVAGDLVSGLSTILVHLPDGDMDEYFASLRRCIELEPQLVLPAHGPPYGPGSDLLGKTLRHREMREGKIAAALGVASDEDRLLDIAYADTPAALREIARLSLRAHLKKLKVTL